MSTKHPPTERTVLDDLLRDPDHLSSLLQETPQRLRLHFLTMNFDLWKDTFPEDAANMKQEPKLRIVK